jgi:hypothetical protein
VRAAAQLRQATALVEAALGSAVPEEVAVEDALAMCRALGTLGKLAAAGCRHYAKRVGEDPAGVLAGARGTSRATARRELEAAGAANRAPVVGAALGSGDLSVDQARVLAPAAAAVPGAAGGLVALAKAGASLEDLALEAARTLRAARGEADQVAAELRLDARRCAKVWHAPDGTVRLWARLGPLDGAGVLACLEKETDALFAETAGKEPRWRRDHLMADALVGLVTGSARAKGARVLVHVDAAALRRGEARGAERCEIAGVGPVSVRAVRALLGQGWASLLVEDGADVTTVTSFTRAVPARMKTALLARDGGCVVPGCPATRGLELHHWRTGFFEHGPTSLDNLSTLCRRHHAMVTKAGWRLGGGPGRWVFLPPRRSAKPARDARPGRDGVRGGAGDQGQAGPGP